MVIDEQTGFLYEVKNSKYLIVDSVISRKPLKFDIIEKDSLKKVAKKLRFVYQTIQTSTLFISFSFSINHFFTKKSNDGMIHLFPLTKNQKKNLHFFFWFLSIL